jgi:hypothetical protein
MEHPGSHEQVAACSSFARADLIFFMLIVVFGSSSVLLHRRTADFLGEDVFFADAAQSLLHHGFYGVNGNSETTMPPGLSGILAVLFSIFGYSNGVCVGAMAVFEALGFLVAYEVLRRRVSRLVAATICILLLSSPLYFAWATRIVAPCFPYFFTTMVALQSGEEYEKAATTRSRIIWGTVLTVAVAASLLIATGTIALLGAMVAVVVLTALQNRRLARTRLLKFLPVFLVGIAVQGLWMHRKPAPPEWSLRGYPGSYLEQIRLKSGNQPELGLAKWSDIPVRVTTNLTAESDIFAELVLRHGISRTKVALVIIPVLLIAIGWIYSVWITRGMELVDWYFAGYEFIYMLWPWTMEPRFLLPIAPLACFYMWQAIKGVLFASRAKPRVVGIIWFPAALLLTILGAHSVYTNWTRGKADLPDELMIPMWLISAGCALWMAYTGRSIFSTEAFSRTGKWVKQPLGTRRVSPFHLLRYAGYLLVTGLVVIGIVIESRIARENLNTIDLVNAEETGAREIKAPEVEAGVWIRSHTPPDSVVMARHWPTVFHYAKRKLVWFAPISDPDVLLDGIMKHSVDYIVVVKHDFPYYLPDDDYCFDRLLAVYAKSFSIVLQRGNLRIFKVDERAMPEPLVPNR